MTPLPKTYKAAVFEEKGKPLVIKDIELKKPEDGQILVKVIACGVCHSDTIAQNDEMGGGLPRIPGHEIIGDVVDVPSSETKWKVGDRVGGAWHGGHDQVCKQCRQGWFQQCANGVVNGISRDGGYAEYVLLRTEAAAAVPKDIDPVEYAPILCAGVTVYNSIRNQKVTPGSLVAVQGLGGLGHLAIQYAKAMGYRVVALSSGGDKVDFAKKLGAHDYIDGSKGDTAEQLMKMGGADLICSTAPNPKIIGGMTAGLAPGGHLLVLAPVGPIEVNTLDLVLKRATVSGFPSGHALDSEEAIAFTSLHNIHCMVERFPLKDAQKAFDHMVEGKARFRAVLVM